MKLNKPLILFDSECTVCSRFKQGLQLLDLKKQLDWLSIHSSEIANIPVDIDIEEIRDSIHLITPDLKIIKGHNVIAYLAKLYPGVSKLAWLLETDIGKKASQLFYERVNNFRKSQIEKCPKCNKTH